VDEKSARYETFKANLKFIDEQNAKQSSYTLGLNQFSDLTNAEFRSKHLSKRVSGERETTPFRYANVTPASSIDWTKKGAVTPKDQGQCGTRSNSQFPSKMDSRYCWIQTIRFQFPLCLSFPNCQSVRQSAGRS
jgi:hypothetical protein